MPSARGPPTRGSGSRRGRSTGTVVSRQATASRTGVRFSPAPQLGIRQCPPLSGKYPKPSYNNGFWNSGDPRPLPRPPSTAGMSTALPKRASSSVRPPPPDARSPSSPPPPTPNTSNASKPDAPSEPPASTEASDGDRSSADPQAVLSRADPLPSTLAQGLEDEAGHAFVDAVVGHQRDTEP